MSETAKKSLLKAFSEFLESVSGGTNRNTQDSIEVLKSVSEERKQATFLVLKAMSDDTEYDLHGDTYSADEVADACHNYNINCMKANLGHLMMIDKGVAQILESYITPMDLKLNDEFIPKGSWLQVWQFANDGLWEDVKKGYWTGVSIGCTAHVEEIADES